MFKKDIMEAPEALSLTDEPDKEAAFGKIIAMPKYMMQIPPKNPQAPNWWIYPNNMMTEPIKAIADPIKTDFLADMNLLKLKFETTPMSSAADTTKFMEPKTAADIWKSKAVMIGAEAA